jgi:hypothetical protein
MRNYGLILTVIFLLIFHVDGFTQRNFSKEQIKAFATLKHQLDSLDKAFYKEYDMLLEENAISKKEFNEISLAQKKGEELPTHITSEKLESYEACSEKLLNIAHQNRNEKQAVFDKGNITADDFEKMMKLYQSDEKFREKVDGR